MAGAEGPSSVGVCWRGIPGCLDLSSAKEFFLSIPAATEDPKASSNGSEDGEAGEPEADGNASSQPGQMEGDRKHLPMHGEPLGLIIPGHVLPESRAMSTSAWPLSEKGSEETSL